jgi:asparagine synthase (glutamine-hydrolysing)
MCGIAGIWNLDGSILRAQSLEDFTDTLTHRGPDGSGYYLDEKACLGLGHRRLSIIDLSDNGKQPMSFADGRYWLTYNGEVFNFIELQSELELEGYRFQSTSDSEVILAAYHRWGTSCLKKFNGMWGLAIWDTQEQTLFLARDRFGIKPLYYKYKPGKLLAFASETIAFKQLEGQKREIRKENLSRTLQSPTSLTGSGETIFEDVYQLLPGHFIKMTRSGDAKQNRWWSTAENKVKIPLNYEEQVAEFKTLFEDSCRLRMRSDVPLATALSGGVDSSAVNCMMAHLMERNAGSVRIPEDWRHAFVSSSKGTSQDERHFAEEVIQYTGSKAFFIEPDYKGMVSGIDSMALAFDDIMDAPVSIISELYGAMHNQGIKVSLDGHGVDEMLFGYPYMVREAYLWVSSQKDKKLLGSIEQTYIHLFENAGQSKAKIELLQLHKNTHSNRLKFFLRNLLPEEVIHQIRRRNEPGLPSYLHLQKSVPITNHGTPEDLSSLSDINRAVYLGFHEGLLQNILRNFDRASMQKHVEIRMPFMDWRLVSFVFSLPLESKLGGGFTKRILRDSMKGLMPENIRTRTLKLGFSAPLVDWFNASLKEYILDKVNSVSFLTSDVWTGEMLRIKALNNYKNNSWTWKECSELWTCINADIISH